MSAYSDIVLQLKLPAYTRRTYQVFNPPVTTLGPPSPAPHDLLIPLDLTMGLRAFSSCSHPQSDPGRAYARLFTPLTLRVLSLVRAPGVTVLHPSAVISIPLQKDREVARSNFTCTGFTSQHAGPAGCVLRSRSRHGMPPAASASASPSTPFVHLPCPSHAGHSSAI